MGCLSEAFGQNHNDETNKQRYEQNLERAAPRHYQISHCILFYVTAHQTGLLKQSPRASGEASMKFSTTMRDARVSAAGDVPIPHEPILTFMSTDIYSRAAI